MTLSNRCAFDLPTLNGSTFAWDSANPSGVSSVSGNHLVAKATYTTLPANNTDFGAKQAEFHCDGIVDTLTNADFEVFFPRDSLNHPQPDPQDPNWLYYYRQIVSRLLPSSPTPHIGPQSEYAPQTNTIAIDSNAIQPYFPHYGTNGQLSGIDTFFWAFTHEMQHHKDWQDFWQIDTQGVTLWRAAFGKPGPNGNLDGDDFPNWFEDPNGNGVYDAGDPYDLTTEFTAGNSGGIEDREDRNCKIHKAVTGDHSKDWANPGKQHK